MNAELSDEQIVIQVQKGDTESFGILVERYEEKLQRYGRKFLSIQESIEDSVQDVFLSAYQNIRSFNASLSFSSWVYRIAHNAFVNELRRRSRSPIIFFDLDTLLSHPIYEDPKGMEEEYAHTKKVIEQCLEKLAPKYREVLVLHYFEELAYKDIADVLGVPTGTVGIRLKRAKEALKKVYDTNNHGRE